MTPDIKDKKILHHLAGGLTAKEIAGKVGLSVAGVKSRMKNMRGKTAAKNNAELVAWSFMNGVLCPITAGEFEMAGR